MRVVINDHFVPEWMVDVLYDIARLDNSRRSNRLEVSSTRLKFNILMNVLGSMRDRWFWSRKMYFKLLETGAKEAGPSRLMRFRLASKVLRLYPSWRL